MTPASIRRSNAKARKMLLALRLAEFRRALRVDQSKVRGFSQPAVSKIEGRGDLKLSTLVDYCHGLGAELKIVARQSKTGKKSSSCCAHERSDVHAAFFSGAIRCGHVVCRPSSQLSIGSTRD